MALSLPTDLKGTGLHMKEWHVPLGAFEPVPEFGGRYQQAIMPVVAQLEDTLVPIGTTFAINPSGLLLTAKHVVDHAVDRASAYAGRAADPLARLQLWAFYVSNERHGPEDNMLGGPLPVRKVWTQEELDIAVLWVDRPILGERGPLELPAVGLSPGVPRTGEAIGGFGYHEMSGRIESGDEAGTIIHYEQNFTVTTGRITEVHDQYRDNVMLNFPCFRTDARFDPGMSGGPIFCKNGFVCGVICSGSDPTKTDAEYLSYGSLLWPALGIKVLNKKNDRVEEPTLYQLALDGDLQVDESIDRIRVVTNPDGSRTVQIVQQ